jgi:hypothetical protein
MSRMRSTTSVVSTRPSRPPPAENLRERLDSLPGSLESASD